jgi:phenylpropionate dioxygenase-like ring-hydroxylating dioxygenase large terminal subunit
MLRIASYPEDSAGRMRAEAKARLDHPGYALTGYFYRSAVVYQTDLEKILYRSWLYAGHTSQIPEPGDFFQYEVDEDAFIVTRGEDGVVRALVNSCRHRGARVCEEASGTRKTFVCPYHGWVYGTDGSLRGARHMDRQGEFCPGDSGLKQLRVFIRHGLIFINADPDAGDFSLALDRIDPALAPYELENAKIAHRQVYRVDANWKLALENYLECYHCATSHRSYARSHSIKEIAPNVEVLRAALWERSQRMTGVEGVTRTFDGCYDAEAVFGTSVWNNRYALFDGFQSASQDGKPVAPLMGQFRGFDGGAGDFQIGPLSFMLNYPDHCVLYRFTPRGLTATDIEVVWFVRSDALEGRDYDLQTLTWLWDVTTQEDEYIITRNSAGVNSRFYEPGPLQPDFEYIEIRFIKWYLEILALSAAP